MSSRRGRPAPPSDRGPDDARSPRLGAAAGTVAFLVVAPGVVAGVVRYLLTGWERSGGAPGVAAVGGWLLVAAGPAALPRRFGAEYEAYRGAVPGWWPRRRPWSP